MRILRQPIWYCLPSLFCFTAVSIFIRRPPLHTWTLMRVGIERTRSLLDISRSGQFRVTGGKCVLLGGIKRRAKIPPQKSKLISISILIPFFGHKIEASDASEMMFLFRTTTSCKSPPNFYLTVYLKITITNPRRHSSNFF